MRFFADLYEGLVIAFRALRANKLRALLTILGILIGVTTVILMICIILGLNRAFENQFAFLGSNTLYVSKWTWDSHNWRQMMKRPEIEPWMAKRVEEESQLALAVSPWSQTSRTVSYRNNYLSRVEIMGVSEKYLTTNTIRLDLGRFISEDDVSRNRHVAVIGSGLAEKLFDREGPLDQRISIGGHKFRVIGVNEKMGKFFGQSMDDFCLIPFTTFIKRFGRFNDVNIVAKSATADGVSELEWELRGIMRRLRKLPPTEPDDFGINGQQMIMDLYHRITGTVYFGGVLIAFISLLVGGIGIMNIMLVSVTERTSEIGLRKALGARRWMVAWQFLVESAVLCSLGGIVGVGLAYLGSRAINHFIPTSMPLWVVVFGIGFSALVGTFFGLYPALKAARLSPIEALRQE